MTPREIYEAAMRLDVDERAVLAAQLQQSVDDEAPDTVDAAWLDEARGRSDDLHSGRLQPIAWSDIKAARVATLTPEERAEYDAAYDESDLALELAQLFYDTRRASGLSQADLAQRMGTSQSTISLIENGGQVPSVGMLRRLARAVGHDIPYVISAT